jgi:ATP-dependent DNA helicase RecQ
MAALVEGSIDEVLSKVVSDIQLATGHCIQLKEEQDKAVRDLLKGKDVFAVLPTGYGKSLIYQAFVRARDYQTSGKAAIIVISPLNSIIKDQLKDMERQCYSAVDASAISLEDIRQCKFKIIYASAEMVGKKSFRDILKDPSSPLHQNITAIVIDESHTVETWTGKRYDYIKCICIKL